MGLRNRKFTDDMFVKAVKNNISKSGVLKSLGLIPAGANYRMFNILVRRMNIDTSHFKGQGYLKGKEHNWSKKIPLSKILVKNSSYTSSHKLKNRLIRAGYIEEKCSECSITIWHGKKLSLHLDHINGNNIDNRMDNLRLLCPNCHSLTPTYCGKNKRRK